jgi:signal transduction histidine kinase
MEFKQNLYLIFKEGINNAIKHSGCKKIFLEASLNKDVVEMILRDDGLGFNTGEQGTGNGIMNMTNRAKTIGSDLSINSSREGTTIRFTGRIGGIKKTIFAFFK